jgi:hypothetical protein
MSGRAFIGVARWLLTRLLVALLAALAVAVIARQFTSSSTPGHPLTGEDHWHAPYQIFICGQQQPNFPTWNGGVHTHSDGVIHIHPVRPEEEGDGARLVKWFEYGGGNLTQSEMLMPGDSHTFTNGDQCPDGNEGILHVLVNGEELDDWNAYIPQDGDVIRIVFGPAKPQ